MDATLSCVIIVRMMNILKRELIVPNGSPERPSSSSWYDYRSVDQPTPSSSLDHSSALKRSSSSSSFTSHQITSHKPSASIPHLSRDIHPFIPLFFPPPSSSIIPSYHITSHKPSAPTRHLSPRHSRPDSPSCSNSPRV